MRVLGLSKCAFSLHSLSLLALLALPALTALNAGELDFDVLFGDNPAGELPAQITWSPEGNRLSYIWDDGTGEALWVLDLATDEAVAHFRDEEIEVEGHQWSPLGTELLVETGEAALLVPLDGSEVKPLTPTGGEEDPRFSPGGDRVAFVRDFDLHLVDRAMGEERRLTTGGLENELLHGVTDWVYWEEIWNRDSTGFWWSPDGSRLAYYEFDETPVPEYPLVNYLETDPEVEWQRYPKAGDPLPLVRVGVLDLESGGTVWMGTAAPESHYFARVHWSPEGDRLAISQLNRDQNRLDLLSCDAESGSCRVLMTETSATWVNLHDDYRSWTGGGFLWSSEKSGFRALYLHDEDGREIRRLTPEGLAVSAVRGFNAEADWVIYDAFETSELGAASRGIFKQDLATGTLVELAAASGTQRATVSDATGSWVHTWSDVDSPGGAAIRDLDGREIGALPQRPPEGYDPAALPSWKFATIPGPGEERLPIALLRPAGFDPGRRYPVIMYHYGCPASQVVTDAWGRRGRGLWHKMMAERGYVVLMLDNLASNFFGKAGADRAYRSFGPGNVAAQLAGAEYLASQPWADLDRIGLWGWSGGGYNTLYALTHAPGVWKAGVAGAPVADWKFYDAIWTERYMDTPEDNPEGYATASALDAAERLEDRLLIVHGTGDDNVHPQNTIAMSARLIAAGKSFEQAIHPRQKHGFRGTDSRHFYERMTEFFDRHLAGHLAGKPEPEPQRIAPPPPKGARR